jgi:iron complex transport system substrate-binding protein
MEMSRLGNPYLNQEFSMPLSLSRRRAARIVATAVATLSLATLAACSSTADAESTSAGTRTVDSVYGEIEVPATPERVAAVSYDTPWQLMSLDVTPVAAQDYGRWIDSFSQAQQDFVEGVPTIGTFGEINYEAIAATEPDLIIGEAGEVDEVAFDRLSDIAPTVIVGGDTRGDWGAITEDTATAVGKSELWATEKAEFEATRDHLKTDYADVISGNEWIHFSLGDDASQFSVQQPTGATGNLVVNELGLEYGPGVPTDYADSGYGSYPLEQLGPIFDGVTVALTFANADGSPNEAIQAIEDNELFTRLAVAQNDHVFHLVTSVTDYKTATEWLNEVEEKVLAVL